MNRKGIIFLDIILALFVLGLIIVILFPTFSLIDKSFEISKEITDSSYFIESIMEDLRSKNSNALEFLEELQVSKELEYPYLKDERYISNVKLLDSPANLWNLDIIVRKKDNKGGREYVEIKATIPK